MDGYGPQVGALALAAVSVHKLTLFASLHLLICVDQVWVYSLLYRKTGIDIHKIECPLRIYEFADDPWGLPACNLTKRSQGLSEESWELIIDHAAEFLSKKEQDILKKRNSSGDNGDSGVVGDWDMNPHAYIDIDWCVS